MIVPMKKVSLVVLDRERRDALKKLRSLGVVHLEPLEGSGELLQNVRGDFTKVDSALSLLQDIPSAAKKNATPPVLSRSEAVELAGRVLALAAEKKSLEDISQKNSRELDRYRKWGDVDPAQISFLRGKGVVFQLYEIPALKYPLIPEGLKTVEVNRDKQEVRFLLLDAGETRPEGLPPEAYQVPLPEKSTVDMRNETRDAAVRVKAITDELAADTMYIPALKNPLAVLKADVEFENACSGLLGDDTGSAHSLRWFSGFVPVSDLEKVTAAAKAEHWALLAEEPGDEDNVPTQLKNNKVVQLIDPVMDFLGTVPGYREYDISGWFLLFFAIFFGMIFGDAGYGSLMVIAALGAMLSAAVHKKSVNPAMKLLLLLGATTVVWGTLTCSWFGILPQYLPPVLRNASLWLFNGENPDSGMNLQIFCFILALAQLSIAHLKGIFRNIRSLKAFGDLGSLLMLWGMFTVVLNLVVSSTRFPLTSVTFILVGTGFALNFIFANYSGKIGASILESLKNIVSVLLGVVNVFSDIVSYIRLWAVGIAGAAIAQTVNSMAGPTLGGLLIFLGILLLFFGHGLNMVLNVLSVIVHGVRLNTLEFTSHLGMSWSGFKYEPFSETVEQ